MSTPGDIRYRVARAQAEVVITVASLCHIVNEALDENEQNSHSHGYVPQPGDKPASEVVKHRIFLDDIDPLVSEDGSTVRTISAEDTNGWLHYSQLLINASDDLTKEEGLAWPGPPKEEKSEQEEDEEDEETHVIFFTSGTTGAPKMVRHTSSYARAFATCAHWCMRLRPEDIHWSLSDTGWAKTSYGKLYGQWEVGCTIVQYRQEGRFEPKRVLELVEKWKVTTFCVPPTVYRMLIGCEMPKYDLSSLRHCLSAGEPLNPYVIHKWQEYTGLAIHELFGQTETTLLCTNFSNRPLKAGSMGLPAPGVSVEIVDDEGKQVADMEEGHIVVRCFDSDIPHPSSSEEESHDPEVKLRRATEYVRAVKASRKQWCVPGIFAEYWKDPLLTQKAFKYGYYFTGDKGYRDSDGYLWYIGRSDDVFKASGYRIGPFEVESALIDHRAVQEAAVIGAPDDVRGLVVKAFIILKKGFEPSEELKKELQEHVKHTTAPYKYPRLIEFCTELPKTRSGKIRRAELRAKELQMARGQA